MWIAFIFVSLNYQKHCTKFNTLINIRCELLSFLYLWTIKSITHSSKEMGLIVVNCFHFCIFELSKAFVWCASRMLFKLWIAFIFVSLNYQKHFRMCRVWRQIRCELLSFLYLWTIKSIEPERAAAVPAVVNCFHFCIFELSKALRCLYLSDI